jgi:uncharacterized protein (DUF433 family)
VGRHIVSDPKICHGQPTFRGTRILVADVLDQVSDGLAWGTIIEEWHGSLTPKAIAEAVTLAGRAFLDHAEEYTFEPAPA